MQRIEVEGTSPFRQSEGTFEVQISICETKPTAKTIKDKSFTSLWNDKFHLTVKNGKFTEVL